VINASLFDVMNFIRESGSIKQDASTIAYIQVEHSEERKDVKDAKYTVLKNRNGEAFASVELRFEGALFRFTEI
jgi:replicative DNA helicase